MKTNHEFEAELTDCGSKTSRITDILKLANARNFYSMQSKHGD